MRASSKAELSHLGRLLIARRGPIVLILIVLPNMVDALFIIVHLLLVVQVRPIGQT